MFQFAPDPNLGRRQQIFQVWIRPVEPKNGLFTLRAGLYELNKLVKNGMSQEDFEATRRFLTKNVNALTKTQDAQLGYALDSRYYGISGLHRLRARSACEATARGCESRDQEAPASRQRQDRRRDQGRRTRSQAALDGKPSPISYTSMPRRRFSTRTRSSRATSSVLIRRRLRLSRSLRCFDGVDEFERGKAGAAELRAGVETPQAQGAGPSAGGVSGGRAGSRGPPAGGRVPPARSPRA